MDRYNKLDDVSKKKDTIESFQRYAKLSEWFIDIMKEKLDIPIDELCTQSGGQKRGFVLQCLYTD